jgi:hypothetical protein
MYFKIAEKILDIQPKKSPQNVGSLNKKLRQFVLFVAFAF